MAKTKSYFFCSECGYQSSSWLGKCPECGKWNTFTEEVVETSKKSAVSKNSASIGISTPKLIGHVTTSETKRVSTGCSEFDRVLGGGIVPGSLLLLGGEPGIGKSTLLLQTALRIPGKRILYVSGEESEEQIKMRADRLSGERKAESGKRRAENGEQRTGNVNDGINNAFTLSNNNASECYVVSETVTQRIFDDVDAVKPDLLIVDSIQTISTDVIDSSAGSISQIRECTSEFQRLAKESGLPILLVGHITKEGSLAGPKVMEHIVDTVLQFEGDRNYGYRMLRSLKNRFGSTAEIGIFEMQGDGLRQVTNPSEFLLSQRDENLSGCVVSATLEGARPMFIEVQSLVSSAVYGTPQRNANGFDFRRLSMLLAVLEKRCGFKLGAKDVFLNIAGGVRVNDPAIDLAVACAVLSSNVDIPISPRFCFAAEMGLSGELRSVSRVEQRIADADRLGFEKIFISKDNARSLNKKNFGIKIVEVSVIEEVFRSLFG